MTTGTWKSAGGSPPGSYFDPAEVTAVAQCQLQLQQGIGVEGCALLDVHELLHEVRVEYVLLDTDRAKEIARAGIQQQLNLRAVLRLQDAQLGALVTGIEIACRQCRLQQCLLGRFIVAVQQLFSSVADEWRAGLPGCCHASGQRR